MQAYLLGSVTLVAPLINFTVHQHFIQLDLNLDY